MSYTPPGLVIQLASDLAIEVRHVELTGTMLAIQSEEIDRLVLPPVASLDARTGQLAAGFRHDADAVLWSDLDVMHLRVPGKEDRILSPGDSFSIGGRRYQVLQVQLKQVALESTAPQGGFQMPFVLKLRYDSVHICRGADVLAVDGVPARILTELALIGVPVEWRTIAGLIWPKETDDSVLRQKWDGGLARLRKRLRELGLRKDLLRGDGAGLVELFLRSDDRVVDDA